MPSAAMNQVPSSQVLTTLLLCGLMGLLGQGVRAVVGLKSQTALAPDGQPAQQNVFNAAYFTISLMIGFIAGVLAGLAIGVNSLLQIDPGNLKVLLGIAAAGYAGADFIENTFARLIPGAAVPPRPPSSPSALAERGAPLALVAPLVAAEIIDLRAAVHVTAPRVDLDIWTPALSEAFGRFDMSSPRRMAAALGQFLVEAGPSLQATTESLVYTHPEHIVAVFGQGLFPNLDAAVPYVNAPERLANYVYADRNGNGDVASGDGWRFRGRGLIQLTGRLHYATFAAATVQTIGAAVAACEMPPGAAMSACWFLVTNHCLPLADAWDIDRITRVVNAKLMGAAQRLVYANTALRALGG